MIGFRDRISLLTALTGIVLALQPALVGPRYVFTWYPLGTPLTVTVGPPFFLGVLLFLIVVPGTQWILSAWDVPAGTPPFVEGAWTLPLAIAWIAQRLLPYQVNRHAWLMFLLSTLLVMALTWHSLCRLLGQVAGDFPAGFVLRTLAFASGGTLYLWLYTVGERSLLSATQMLVGSYLLAAALWVDVPVPLRVRWLYSAVLGVIIGQLAWMFRHTALSPLRGGLLLLLVFYALALVFERAMRSRLTVRFLGEILLTGVLALVLIFLFAPAH
ncbi:MAG: hypothetical protein GXO55_02855 [Chloroflexi bacterium]|nr:hypothetical protein [Chloroflexota bacterium]